MSGISSWIAWPAWGNTCIWNLPGKHKHRALPDKHKHRALPGKHKHRALPGKHKHRALSQYQSYKSKCYNHRHNTKMELILRCLKCNTVVSLLITIAALKY